MEVVGYFKHITTPLLCLQYCRTALEFARRFHHVTRNSLDGRGSVVLLCAVKLRRKLTSLGGSTVSVPRRRFLKSDNCVSAWELTGRHKLPSLEVQPAAAEEAGSSSHHV